VLGSSSHNKPARGGSSGAVVGARAVVVCLDVGSTAAAALEHRLRSRLRRCHRNHAWHSD
jgi:hypothetical protein